MEALEGDKGIPEGPVLTLSQFKGFKPSGSVRQRVFDYTNHTQKLFTYSVKSMQSQQSTFFQFLPCPNLSPWNNNIRGFEKSVAKQTSEGIPTESQEGLPRQRPVS